jgi:hypothetical protein
MWSESLLCRNHLSFFKGKGANAKERNQSATCRVLCMADEIG